MITEKERYRDRIIATREFTVNGNVITYTNVKYILENEQAQRARVQEEENRRQAAIAKENRLNQLKANNPHYALIGTEWKYSGISMSFDFDDNWQVTLSHPDWETYFMGMYSNIIYCTYTFDGTRGSIKFDDGSTLSFTVSGRELDISPQSTTISFMLNEEIHKYRNGTFYKQ